MSKALKGVRATGELTLCRGRDTVAESRGEVQFTEFGVSGPAVFDLSRSAAVEKPPLTLHIDLLPGCPRRTRRRCCGSGPRSCRS